MFRIAPMAEKKITVDTAVTIDHAIHLAKKAYRDKDSDGFLRVLAVYDGDRVRATVNLKGDGRACWVVPCKTCAKSRAATQAQSVNTMGVFGWMTGGGPPKCDKCIDGLVEDLPCA